MASPIDIAVAASGDDGWADDTSQAFDIDDTLMTAGNQNNTGQQLFARFVGITIPSGQNITVATLGLMFNYAYAAALNVRLSGDDSNDPVAPTSYALLNGITPTTAHLDITSITGMVQYEYFYFDIQSIVAELYASYGAFSSEALQFILRNNGSGDGSRIQFFQWDWSAHQGKPLLHVEYEASGSPPAPTYSNQRQRMMALGLI